MKYEEKRRNDTNRKPVRKKGSFEANPPKPELSKKLTTEPKTSKPPSLLLQQKSSRVRTLKPKTSKTRSTSLIDKVDHTTKKNENNEIKSYLEKPKKYISLDEVDYASLRDISKATLANKVTNVLQQRKNSQVSFQGCPMPKTLHSYPSRLNFLSKTPQNHPTEKVQSYHAIKIVNKLKRPCKCVSFESNKEKPVAVFNIRNKSYRQVSDTSSDPLWHRMHCLNNQTPPTGRHKWNSRSEDKNHPNRFVKNSDLVKNPEDKKPMKVCQCLHYHTEDGVRQFPVQNKQNNQEIGQKLFRVKYVSKNEENSIEKETIPENKTSSHVKLHKKPSQSIKFQKKFSSIESFYSENEEEVSGKTAPDQIDKKTAEETEELSSDNNDLKRAKQELETLQKLFSKLNNMDEKKPPSVEPSTKKWTDSQLLAEKACRMLKDIEAEEIYLKERNKLRQKIIRHVQNFIKLEFNES